MFFLGTYLLASTFFPYLGISDNKRLFLWEPEKKKD